MRCDSVHSSRYERPMADGFIAWLPALQFWQLEVLFWLAAALSVWELPRLVKHLAAPPGAWAAAIASGLVALALVVFVAPRTNRILYDELIYQHIGQNLTDRHRAEMCNDGVIERGRLQCARAEYNKQPDGYPQLLSVAYAVAGVREVVAWHVNNACTALLPLVIFAAAMLLFSDAWAAIFAALLSALMPEALLWGNTAAVEPSATITSVWAVLCAAWFVRSRRTSALVWTAVCTVYACQFRPESPLIAAIVVAIIWTGAPDEVRRTQVSVCALLAVVLASPLGLHILAERRQPWGSTGDRISLAFLWNNLRVNGPFYFSNIRFPAMATAFAVWGVVTHRRDGLTRVAAIYFLLMWGTYLSFYAGSYNYGADVRYSLLTYPPVAWLGGLGISALGQRIRWRGWPVAIATALALQFLWFVPLVHAVGEDGWAARTDVADARAFARLVPADGLVLTHNPSMFLLWGTNAAQMSLAATDEEFVRTEITSQPNHPVYFHDNFWCAIGDAVQSGFCRAMRSRFVLEPVAEVPERGLRYGLYRIRGVKPIPGV